MEKKFLQQRRHEGETYSFFKCTDITGNTSIKVFSELQFFGYPNTISLETQFSPTKNGEIQSTRIPVTNRFIKPYILKRIVKQIQKLEKREGLQNDYNEKSIK